MVIQRIYHCSTHLSNYHNQISRRSHLRLRIPPPKSKICWHVLRKLRAIYDTTRNLALVIFLSLPLMYYITSKSSNPRSFVINSFCRHDNKIQKSRRKNEWIAWYNNYNDWKILINKIGRGSVCNYVRQNRVVFISIIAIVPRIFFFLI